MVDPRSSSRDHVSEIWGSTRPYSQFFDPLRPDSSSPVTDLLHNRYRLGPEIGRGGQGKTYVGQDLHTGQTVAVKELSLAIADDWKAIELFQREGLALRQLHHPAIPSYIDAFVDDDGPSLRFFLVREYVEGQTFQELIEAGENIATTDVVAFIEEVLDILDYLHDQHPPVIHRDIKPSNLILRPDGSVALIDFGAVQVVGSHTLMSTVVGTSGYVAPEQLAGRTRPASDLYSLGATVVHLLSHLHPADLPMERMRLLFEDRVGRIPPRLMRFLKGVLEPAVEDRIDSVQEARQVLRGSSSRLPALRDNRPLAVTRRPMGSQIQIDDTGGRLTLTIPAPRRYRLWFWSGLLVAGSWLLWTLPTIDPLFLPWFVGAIAAYFLVGQMFITPTRLSIDEDHFVLLRKTVNGKHKGWTEALLDVEERGPGDEKFLFLPLPGHLVLMEGVYPYPFAFGLSSVERRWLQSVLRARLELRRS